MNILKWAGNVLDNVDNQAAEKVQTLTKQFDAADGLQGLTAALAGSKSKDTNNNIYDNNNADTDTNESSSLPPRSASSSRLVKLDSSSSTSTSSPPSPTSTSTRSITPARSQKKTAAKPVADDYMSLLNTTTSATSTSPSITSTSTSTSTSSRPVSPAVGDELPPPHPKSNPSPLKTSTSTSTSLARCISNTSLDATDTEPSTATPTANDDIPTPRPIPTSTSTSTSSTTKLSSSSSSNKLSSSTSSSTSSSASDSALAIENKLLKNDMQELSSEVTSLRTVWQETRTALQKAKQLLVTKEEQYRKKLADNEETTKQKLKDADTKHLTTLAEQKKQYEDQITEMKQLLAQNQSEFEQALAAKSAHQTTQSREASEYRDRVAQLESELSELSTRTRTLEEERDRLIRTQQEMMEQHQKMLKQLRDEDEARFATLEREHLMHHKTLGTFSSRETTLEADNIEYINALAAAQRALEEKSRQYQQLITEKRFIEANQQSIQDQLTATKARLEAEQKQSSDAAASSRDRLRQLQRQLDDSTKRIAELSADLVTRDQTIKELESRVANDNAHPLQLRITEMEQRLRTMADHLLQKASQLESISAERSALRLQLENESRRVTTLERQLKSALERKDDDGDDVHVDVDIVGGGGIEDDVEAGSPAAKLRSRSRPIQNNFRVVTQLAEKSQTAARVVSTLDQAGQYVGQVLRRYPTVRLVFGVYVVLIHIWVIYVMYHFSHHAPAEMHHK